MRVGPISGRGRIGRGRGGLGSKEDEDRLHPFGVAPRWRVHLCFGPNCTARGSHALLPVLEDAIARAGIGDEVEVIASTCRNRCDFGPSMNVYPGPTFYNELTPAAIEEIVAEHLVAGQPVERWFFRPKPLRRGG